ncbi:Mbov_0186 family lipoprotein [Mycoplasmopsis bovis]|uniref:Mbov_0186 family lipoprotein n=1 Tax=Mycoplasmopsis bovis TaxID=28903 RepID=UPI00244EBEB2|nr:hypothetical protein [Mycoplasmopsis bovis]WMX75980.1 hypothetical protein HYE46_00815 [Mycoplasmopsis bovis]
MIGKLYKSILKNGKKIGIYPFLIGSSIIISSTLIVPSCGEYHQTSFEREHNKFFDFNLYEKRIKKSLKSTDPISLMCSALEAFKDRPIFYKKLSQNFHNFVELINSFSYFPNQEYPGIENEYISYLVYTAKNYSTFYSKSVARTKNIKEYEPKTTLSALPTGNFVNFNGVKYLNEIWKSFDNKNKNDIKLSNLNKLSLKISNNIYKNLLKLESHYSRYLKNFSIFNIIAPHTDASHEFTNSKVDEYLGNFKFIKNVANLLPTINNQTIINNYRKFGIFDVKRETLLINSNKINALTFKFNKLYSANDITVTSSYSRSESRDLMNYIVINFSYRPDLMSFKEFLNFKKKTKFTKTNLQKEQIVSGYIDLDKLIGNYTAIAPDKFNVLEINTQGFGSEASLWKENINSEYYGNSTNSNSEKNIYLDYINFLKMDSNSNNTGLLITPDSWNVNEISKEDWDEMLPKINESVS